MAIGCLTYAASVSHPDLAAAVGILSKFMSKPGKEHWQGVKRVLCYIQGTLNYGLMFTADSTDPALIDADWAGDASTGNHRICVSNTKEYDQLVQQEAGQHSKMDDGS